MGFSEDDRIRSKNRAANEAYELYEGLKVMKYSDSDVIRYAQFAIQNTSDNYRNNIYLAMIRIARSKNGQESNSSSNSSN